MIQEITSPKPKHMQVADSIREQILSGALSDGVRLLSDEEFALKYKVHRHTVAAGMNTLVKEGLLERAPRRGTIVRAKTGNKTSSAVGMVMIGKGDIYGNIAQEITRGLASHRLYPVFIDERVVYHPDSAVRFLDTLVSEGVKPYGFLIEGSLEFPYSYFKSRIDSFHNTVFITRFHHPAKIEGVKYALVDYSEAGRLAARHFIRMGHRRIACLAVPERHYQGEWGSIQVGMLKGFSEVCRESGIEFSDEIFWKLLHGAPLEPALGSILKKKDPVTAIFTFQDYSIRYTLIPLLESRGLKPMKDIEIIGLYNTAHAEICGFSSIYICEEKIAEIAVKMLTGETDESEIFIKPTLAVRPMG